MIIDGNFNHVRLIESFEALIKQAGLRVFLVLDNLGVHHCKPVKKWLAEHMEQIEVFYVLSYSPQVNPDERLNGDLKQAIETRVRCRAKDTLHTAATHHMAAIEKNSERIKAFFQAPIVAYAAAIALFTPLSFRLCSVQAAALKRAHRYRCRSIAWQQRPSVYRQCIGSDRNSV